MDKLRHEFGQHEFCTFLEERWGPNGSHPWKLGYNSSSRVGIIMEQQQIESYYGIVKPNTKLGREGAMKTDTGFKYLTQQGFASLLNFDYQRQKKFCIGQFSQATRDALNEWVPEYFVLALLMDQNVDYKEMVIAPNDDLAAEFLRGVSGYLCNGPRHIGNQISESDIANYIRECTVRRPDNSWTDGFDRYINLTQRFCLVQPLWEYSESSNEARIQVKHLLDLFPEGTYFCNCPMYWSRLHCPASLFINDIVGSTKPSFHDRITLPYHGRDTTRATPGRRRGPRLRPQRHASYLWEALGLNAELCHPTLEYLAGCSKCVLDRAANMRHFPHRIYTSKTDAIIQLLAGTGIGNYVHLEGTFDRRRLAGSWEELQARSFTNGRIFSDERNYNAMFNPFPEGHDMVFPDHCTSHWINLANVEITIDNVHVISFLLACRHVSIPGTNGRVADHILSKHSTISEFLLFYNANRYIVTFVKIT
jgi:hypothetical protein